VDGLNNRHYEKYEAHSEPALSQKEEAKREELKLAGGQRDANPLL
jgi:hypothetical protein